MLSPKVWPLKSQIGITSDSASLCQLQLYHYSTKASIAYMETNDRGLIPLKPHLQKLAAAGFGLWAKVG